MGRRHIISISEDAIALNRDRDEELSIAIGRAVISLCHDTPEWNMSGPNAVRVEWRDILNCGSAIERAGDVDYNDTCVFAFAATGLKRIDQLDSEELRKVAAVVEAERSRRVADNF